jgi:hypothetical protein
MRLLKHGEGMPKDSRQNDSSIPPSKELPGIETRAGLPYVSRPGVSL